MLSVQRQPCQRRHRAVGQPRGQIAPQLVAGRQGGNRIRRSRERFLARRDRRRRPAGSRLQLGQPGQHAHFPGVASPARPLRTHGLDRRLRRQGPVVVLRGNEQEAGPRGDVAVALRPGGGEGRFGLAVLAVAAAGNAFQQAEACAVLAGEPDPTQLGQECPRFGRVAMIDQGRCQLQAEPAPQRVRVALGQPAGSAPFLGR